MAIRPKLVLYFVGESLIMSFKKILLVVVTSLVVFGGLTLPCQAQNSLNRRRPLRWLGQGYSDGYHRHNPAHDTSYYNPYTAHNSTLVSQRPEYQAILAQQASQQPTQRFFAGVPFSVYAAPSQLTPGIHNLPGQEVQGSFSPSVGSGLLDSGEDDASDNSFQRSDDNDFRDDDNDFREDDSNFREDDSDFQDDASDFQDNDSDFQDDDSDFQDDDSDFQDNDGDFQDGDSDFGEESMDGKEPKKEMKLEDIEDVDVDTTDDLGGLSGLNDSLSFDLD